MSGRVSSKSLVTARSTRKSYSLLEGSQRLRQPRARKFSATNVPRKPLPPVTTTRLFVQKLMCLTQRPAGGRMYEFADRVMPLMPVAQFILQDQSSLAGRLQADCFHIRIHHDGHQVSKVNSWLPLQFLFGLGGVRTKRLHFERAEIAFRNLDVISPVKSGVREGFLDKFTDRVRFSKANYKIVRLLLLQNSPGALHVFRRIAPVPLRFQISEVQNLLAPGQNPSEAPGDFASDKCFAAARAFVIEKNSIGRIQAVAFAVRSRHPVAVYLGDRVRAARFKWSVLILGRGRRAEHFRTGGLVKSGFDSAAANGFQNPHGAESGNVAGVFGNLKADLDVTLRGEVINFIRRQLVDQIENPFGAAQISVVQAQSRTFLVRILIDVVDALGVERAGAPNDAVNFVAMGQKKFGQIGAVLSGDSRNQCSFHEVSLLKPESKPQ